MDQTLLLQEILLLLAAAVVSVSAFRRFGLPPILAYLVVGMVVGPYGLGWIPNTEDTRFIAEIGVVFLLFTVGLEFSLPQLIAMRREVLGLGAAQVAITIGAAGAVAWLAGMPPAAAFVIGAVVAMSSTAIVIRQLTEQLETGVAHGRNAVGILLFQDAAVLPLLIVIPVLAHGSGQSVGLQLLVALGKGGVVVAAMLVAGYWLLRPLFHEIASSRSAELFTLTALLFALTAAWASQAAGLSMTLGGFLAGMLLGETEFRHQVESDIRPFRDVLLGLFFITIGMELDLQALPGIAHWVALVAAALMLFKGASIMVLNLLAGHSGSVAFRTGLVLAQGGEFGFALLSVALGAGLMHHAATQIVLASLIVSMALAPLLIRSNRNIAQRLFSKSYQQDYRRFVLDLEASARELKDHVVICGYGRVGQSIARFVEAETFDFIALDLDPVRVRDARMAGERVGYGDASRRDILLATGIERARALVITFDDLVSSLKVIEQVRGMGLELPILVRTRDDAELDRLRHAGATEVVPETLEASLMLASHLLFLLETPVSRIVRHVQDVRGNRYHLLRGFFHGQEAAALESAVFRERLHTVTLPNAAYAVGRSLGELNLQEEGVIVTAVRRGGIRGRQPVPEMVLQAGDILVLYGTPEDLERSERTLYSGSRFL